MKNQVPIFQVRRTEAQEKFYSYQKPETVARFPTLAEAYAYIKGRSWDWCYASVYVDPDEVSTVILGLESWAGA